MPDMPKRNPDENKTLLRTTCFAHVRYSLVLADILFIFCFGIFSDQYILSL